MDTLLSMILALLILLVIGLAYNFISKVLKKAFTKPYHFYQNQVLLALQENTAKSIILCRYIEGMPYLTQNALYIICANEKQLKFIELANKSKTLNIDFSELIGFQQNIEKKEISEYVTGAIFNTETIVFESCIIKYKIQKGILESKFQYRPLNKIYYDMFNNAAIKECNIFDYVSSHISDK